MEKENKFKTFISGLPKRLSNYLKNYFKTLNYPLWIAFLLLSISLFLADYFTKRAAYYNSTLASGQTIENFIPGLIDLTLTFNKGAAWGSFEGWGWLLILVSSFATVMLTINSLFRFRRYNWGMTIGIALILPGAAGNLIDRIGYAAHLVPYENGVIDFLRFHFMPSFPICNLADYWVTVGIVTLLIGMVFQFKTEYKRLKAEEEAEKANEALLNNPEEKEDMMAKLAQLEEQNKEEKETAQSSEKSNEDEEHGQL